MKMAKKSDSSKNWPVIRTYARLINKGLKTIEDVPEQFRQDVKDFIEGKIK